MAFCRAALLRIFSFLLFHYYISINAVSKPHSSILRIPLVIKNSSIIRLAFAGGIAGGVANGVLYPLDTLKTIRQSDRNVVSIWDAGARLVKKDWKMLYAGFLPSVAGAIPSSALYFGSYEYAKLIISSSTSKYMNLSRPLISMLAACSGNLVSSMVFVPKVSKKYVVFNILTVLLS